MPKVLNLEHVDFYGRLDLFNVPEAWPFECLSWVASTIWLNVPCKGMAWFPVTSPQPGFFSRSISSSRVYFFAIGTLRLRLP